MDILSGRGTSREVGGTVLTVDELVARWESSDVGRGNTGKAETGVQVLKESAKVRGANPVLQMIYVNNRSVMQQVRKAGSVATESFVAAFAGFIMDGMLIGISIALSGGPAGVKVFSDELPVYWRETASGHNSLSYYLGKNISVLPRLVLASLHFTAIYVFLARPPIPASFQFGLILLNFFFMYGIAAIVSMIVRRENAPLVTVVVGLFASVFCGFGLTLSDARDGGYIFVFNIGANRWAAEAQFWLTIKANRLVMDMNYALSFCGYEADKEVQNLFIMLALGVGYRVIAYILLVLVNRQKQK
ncbi:hypothetical protein HDU96_005640 [Phlyctochytrium bullatum]|nr:hypothetical protein HDU96_005640 [Phlyctochytrium bullatum]